MPIDSRAEVERNIVIVHPTSCFIVFWSLLTVVIRRIMLRFFKTSPWRSTVKCEFGRT